MKPHDRVFAFIAGFAVCGATLFGGKHFVGETTPVKTVQAASTQPVITVSPPSEAEGLHVAIVTVNGTPCILIRSAYYNSSAPQCDFVGHHLP